MSLYVGREVRPLPISTTIERTHMTNTLVPEAELSKMASSEHSTTGNLPTTENRAMTIDMENAAFIMDSLTNLYSNPLRSVIREYMANGIDSHIEAGVTDPVEITLPSVWSPNLIIKDKGLGLSLEGVYEAFGSYGTSNKRTKMNVVGAFGMGSKSALAITSSFTVEAVKDGEYTLATVGRNDEGAGQIDIITNEPTDQPNGVTITLALGRDHQFRAQDYAMDLVSYLPSGTVSLDGTLNINVLEEFTSLSDDIFIKDAVWSKNLSRYSGPQPLRVVVGGFSYTVDHYDVADMFEQLPSGNEFSCDEMVIQAPIGSVDLTPSRESLRMTSKTKKIIQGAMDAVFTKMTKEINEEIDKVTKLEDASDVINKFSISLESLIPLLQKCKKVSSTTAYTVSYVRRGDVTHKPSERGTGLSALHHAMINPDTTVILENDKDYAENTLTSRVRAYVNKVHAEEGAPYKTFITLNDGFVSQDTDDLDTPIKFLKRALTTVKASDICAEVNEYTRENRPAKSNGTSRSSGGDVYLDYATVTGIGGNSTVSTYTATADELAKMVNDQTEKPTILLNNTISSGTRVSVTDLRSMRIQMNRLSTQVPKDNLVLVDPAGRKEKFFNKLGLEVQPVDAYLQGLVDLLTSEEVKDVLQETAKTHKVITNNTSDISDTLETLKRQYDGDIENIFGTSLTQEQEEKAKDAWGETYHFSASGRTPLVALIIPPHIRANNEDIRESLAQIYKDAPRATDVIDLGGIPWAVTRYITGTELVVDRMITAGHNDHACAIIESVHYLLQKI